MMKRLRKKETLSFPSLSNETIAECSCSALVDRQSATNNILSIQILITPLLTRSVYMSASSIYISLYI